MNESAIDPLRILQGSASESTFSRAAALGFNHALVRLGDGDATGFDNSTIRALGKSAHAHSVGFLLDIELHRVGNDWPLAQSKPAWFQRVVSGGWPVDPRRDLHARELIPRFENAEAVDGLVNALVEHLTTAIENGVTGFAINWPQRIPAPVLRRIIAETRRVKSSARFIVWTLGLSHAQRISIADAGFNASFCSLPWWDYRAPWFLDELADLRGYGKVIAPVAISLEDNCERANRLLKRAAATAAMCADGWLLQGEPDAAAESVVLATNSVLSRAQRSKPSAVSTPWSRFTAWQAGS